MAQRLLDAFSQYFSNGGEVLTDGQLRFCVSGGSTSDLLDTFSDINLDNPNTNPLPLEAGGRVPDCFGYDQYYKIRLEFTDGTLIQEFDPVGGPASDGEFGPWNNERVYSKNQITTNSNRYWRSVDNGNQGNEPSTSSDWAEIKFIEQYLAGVEYPLDFIVQDSGFIYRGLQAANTGHTPLTNPEWWERIGSIPKYSTKATFSQYSLAMVDGDIYVSQQNTNLNHNPVGDDGTWWRLWWQTIPAFTANYLSGGGNLSAYRNNVLTDGSTYTLPLAASVPENTILVVSMLDLHKGFQPLVQRSGSNLIRRAAGTDTAMLMQQARKISFTLVSNGVDEWRI